VKSSPEGHEIVCVPDHLATVREALEARFGHPNSARLEWAPKTQTPVADEQVAHSLLKLLEALEDNDDVQRVQSNFDIAQDVMERLSA